MSGISPFADVRPGGDPFMLYKVNGSGFRLAGDGDDDYEDDIEGDGISLAGAGLGKGTRKKIAKGIIKFAPKVARAGIGLKSEFGSAGQKKVAANALVAGQIIHGSGCDRGEGVALRALMN